MLKSIIGPESYLSRVKSGFILLIMYHLFALMSFSFVPLYLRNSGLSMWWIVMLYASYTGMTLISITFVHTIYLRRYLFMAFICFSLMAFSLALLPVWISFWAYALLISLSVPLFWLPLNYLFFRSSSRTTNAVDSSFYTILPGLIAMVIPLLAGYGLVLWGFKWQFIFVGFLFILPIIYVRKYIPEEKCSTNLRETIYTFKGLRTITFCEGALQFFAGTVIAVYGLLFLKTETAVGWFFSYVGLLGLIIGLLLSHRSDKEQKRKGYIIFLFLLMAGTIIALPYAKTTFGWYIVVGLFSVVYTISSPLRLAVSLDVKTADMDFWRIRELFLNLGRVVTLGFAALLFYLQWYWVLFSFYGFIALMYPFLVKYKLKGID